MLVKHTPTKMIEEIITSIKEKLYSEVSIIDITKKKKIVELEEFPDIKSTIQERLTQSTFNTKAMI